MRLKNLSIRNFVCFGAVEIDFNRYSDSVLILGENRDSVGLDSNESGKSSLLDSISWTLFGEVPSKILSGDVIRVSTNVCSCVVVFEEGGIEFVVERRRTKSGSNLKFSVGGDDVSLRTFSQTQELVLTTFGLNSQTKIAFNDFFNTVYFSPGVVDAFASQNMTSGRRLELISRFLNLGRLDKALASAKKGISKHSEELSSISGKIEFLSDRISRFDLKDLELRKLNISQEVKDFQQLISTLRRRLKSALEFQRAENQKANLLVEKEAIIRSSEQIRKNLREDYLSTKGEIEEIEKKKVKVVELDAQISKYEETYSLYSSLEEELSKVNSSVGEFDEAILEKNNELDYYLDIKQNGTVCPSCKAPLMMVDGEIVLIENERVLAEISKIEKELNKLHTRRKLVRSNIPTIEDQIKDLDLNGSLDSLVKAKDEALYDIDRIPRLTERLLEIDKKGVVNLKEMEHDIAHIDSQIAELMKNHQKIDDLPAEALENEIAKTEAVLANKKEELSKIEYQLKEYHEIKQALESYRDDKKDILAMCNRFEIWKTAFPIIRKDLIHSFLPHLEDETNKYLQMLHVEPRVLFDLDFSRTNNEFNIFVTDGVIDWKFEQRSRGMQARIALAIGLGLSQLARFDRKAGFDFKLFDEVVDSLDSTGIDEFFGILDNIPGQKFFVSHDTELKKKFPINDIITVVKEEGVSLVK